MNDRKKTFTVQELATVVGVSTSALRAWERRYALFSPERTQGGHRVYNHDDLKLFWYISHLRTRGWDLKQVASLGREALLIQAAEFFELKVVSDNSSSTNNNTECLSPYDEIMRSLRRNNTELAIEGMEKLYAMASSSLRFSDLALEIMMQVGAAWHRGEISVAAEHALTARIKHMLLGLLYLNNTSSAESTHAPLVLCATLPGEPHELGLLRVSIYLKHWGCRVCYLGPSMPVADIHEHVKSTHPNLLIISAASAVSAHHLQSHFQKLSATVAPQGVTVVGGAGIRAFKNHPDFSGIYFSESLEDLKNLAFKCRTINSEHDVPQFVKQLKTSVP